MVPAESRFLTSVRNDKGLYLGGSAKPAECRNDCSFAVVSTLGDSGCVGLDVLWKSLWNCWR